MTQLITEFETTNFVPGQANKAEVGVQSRPSENTPVRLLLVGFGTSDGSMADNTIAGPVTSIADAGTLGGVAGELARAYRKLALRSTDLEVWFARVAEPTGNKATATATIGGTWTTAGELRFIVDGEEFYVTVGASDATTDVATNTDGKVDTLPRLSVTTSVSSSTVTFTKTNKGTRGNSSVLYVDTRKAPSGLTVTLGGAGGSVTGSVETSGAGKRFAGGTGTEDVATILTAIQGHEKHFKIIVVSSLDTTNLGLWETFADTQAGPLVKRPSRLVLAHVGTQSAAQAISKTALNHEAFSVLWSYDAQTPTFEIAAAHAVERVLTERVGPDPDGQGDGTIGWNSSYSGTILRGVVLAADRTKIAVDPTGAQKTALQNGLTPLTLSAAGDTLVVRAISTKCQNVDGGDDYSALDVAEFVCAHEVREMQDKGWQFYRSRNKHVRDDFASNEPKVSGVGTPLGFSRFLAQYLAPLVPGKVFERAPEIRSTYSRSTKRIQTVIKFNRLQLHEQGEALVQSLAP